MTESRTEKRVNNAAAIIEQVFPGLSPDEAGALLQQADIRTYPAATALCRESLYEDVFYILLSGEVEITVSMPDGAIRHLARVDAGRFFGEMALIDDSPRTATATTVSESTVAEVSKATFSSLLSRHPPVARAILRAVTANLRATDRSTIADLSRKNVELYQALQDLEAAQAELIARERMARDLEIAGEVQKSLLPQEFPPVKGWSIHGCNIAAREVGGDYFDVLQLDSSNLALVVADVADKSVQAALYMAVLRTLFVAESGHDRSPRDTVLAVHRGFCEAVRQADTFATVLYGVLNIADASLRYVRAGHDYPLLLRDGGKRIEWLDARGRFIGMVDDLDLEEREIAFNPGDTLMIYSDGMPDAVNLSNASYGMDRFQRVVMRNGGAGTRELCDLALEDVARHQDNAPAQDDITLLAVKRLA